MSFKEFLQQKLHEFDERVILPTLEIEAGSVDEAVQIVANLEDFFQKDCSDFSIKPNGETLTITYDP